MVMHTKLRARETLQEYAEPSRRNVETTGLDPHSFCIGNPGTVLTNVSVDDKMVAVPSAWLEAVCDAAESGDRHFSSPRVGTR
jgi:hypothetical protein